MILKQYYLGCLAHASYLVGDEESGVAAVVDPQRDVDQYVADARELGPGDPLRLPDPLPRRLRRRPPRAARSGRRGDLHRSPRRGGVRGSHVRDRRRRSTSVPRCGSRCSRRRATRRSRSRSSSTTSSGSRRLALRGAHGRHAVHRRRRPARPARRRSAGPPRSSAACSTTPSTSSCSRCPTRRSSTRRTAPARSAARTSAPTPSRRSGCSVATTTRCSR